MNYMIFYFGIYNLKLILNPEYGSIHGIPWAHGPCDLIMLY